MRAYGLLALLSCAEPKAGPAGEDTGAGGEDTGEAGDPTLAILLGLAEVSSRALLDGVVYTAEAQIGQDLDALPDGSVHEGALALPSAQAPAELDASLAADWDLHVEDLDMPMLTWVFQGGLDHLALPSADVAGAFEWGVLEKRWEDRHLSHVGEGTLAIGGVEPRALTFSDSYSGNRRAIEGIVDGEPFAWTNDDPDLP